DEQAAGGVQGELAAGARGRRSEVDVSATAAGPDDAEAVEQGRRDLVAPVLPEAGRDGGRLEVEDLDAAMAADDGDAVGVVVQPVVDLAGGGRVGLEGLPGCQLGLFATVALHREDGQAGVVVLARGLEDAAGVDRGLGVDYHAGSLPRGRSFREG